MHRMFSLLLIFSILASAAPTGHAAPSSLTMLQSQGKNIVNADGKIVQLRGVNAGGWLVQESWMCLTNAPSQMEAFSVLDARFGRETREHLLKYTKIITGKNLILIISKHWV